VVMPVYNERATVAEAIRRARQAELPVDREIVVVDDGSTDGTKDILARLADSTVRVFHQPENRGKGAAVRRGIEEATGDLVVVQDADLEYDPRDWGAMMRPLLEGQARVVYGSRFTGERRNMLFWHWVGNRFLTLLTDVLYNTTLSDMETCYKMMDAQLVRSLRLVSDRFEIEPELTAKLLRSGERIWEVPIRYAGREITDGKKISWRAGVPAMWTLVKYRLVPRGMLFR
ncbi:MAG: glycosyltransferase family 2 protein, partial [Actinomycetota bacterium]|nr:glycosyltransferase family 2 protein [Actinomycetota bacterium]